MMEHCRSQRPSVGGYLYHSVQAFLFSPDLPNFICGRLHFCCSVIVSPSFLYIFNLCVCVCVFTGIQPVKTEWWDAGVVMCLGQGADLHMAWLMPLPLTVSSFSKSRLVLPSWFYLSHSGLPG